jgi:2-oxoglutarate ferredoxin oxidoreductase subunit delta
MTDKDAPKKQGMSQVEPEAAPPGQPASPPEEAKKEYEIDIYRAWCKECGICAAFCPKECLALDEEGRPVVAHAGRCTGCRWCELHCPDFAISVRECVKETPKEEAD